MDRRSRGCREERGLEAKRGISKWEGKERLRAPALFESRVYGGGGCRTTCKGEDVCDEWVGSGEGVLSL